MSRAIDPQPNGGEWAVVTRGLSRRYSSTPALTEVELRVPAGGVYVLLGVNGAGKSTTLRILMNLERPDAGSAQVFGLDTMTHGPEVRARIGYVPEHHDAGYRWMTCARLLRHVATYYAAWDHTYADHLCGEFGLMPDRKIGTLSKGEARRLQLVLALAHRPPLLLLDEPTDGLDPAMRKRLLEVLIAHLADTETTMLLSTHQINEVESLAEHVGILRAGRLIVQQSREELQRTVRRYRIAVPEGWSPPKEIAQGATRRPAGGRELQYTLMGEERDVVARLGAAGARVTDVTTLAVDEAALAFLTDEVSP